MSYTTNRTDPPFMFYYYSDNLFSFRWVFTESRCKTFHAQTFDIIFHGKRNEVNKTHTKCPFNFYKFNDEVNHIATMSGTYLIISNNTNNRLMVVWWDLFSKFRRGHVAKCILSKYYFGFIVQRFPVQTLLIMSLYPQSSPTQIFFILTQNRIQKKNNSQIDYGIYITPFELNIHILGRRNAIK